MFLLTGSNLTSKLYRLYIRTYVLYNTYNTWLISCGGLASPLCTTSGGSSNRDRVGRGSRGGPGGGPFPCEVLPVVDEPCWGLLEQAVGESQGQALGHQLLDLLPEGMTIFRV